jgi:hypothetical protein
MAQSSLAPRPEWRTPRDIARRRPSGPTRAVRVLAIVAGALVLLVAASFFIDEPLRRSMERRMNASLQGYSVRIPRLDFHPIGLSLTLENLELRQTANPEPAILVVPKFHASVQWKELFALRLVADLVIERPKLYVDLTQLRAETADSVPVKERGWQQAIEEIYPLKINQVDVREADVTYIDTDPEKPLRLTKLNLTAENIRNIHSPDRVYPSPIHADGVVFETGRASLDGHANFLADPFPGIHTNVLLEGVALEKFRPVVARSNLALSGGILSLDGRIEYGPAIRGVHLKQLTIAGLKADYVQKRQKATPAGQPAPAPASAPAENVARAARKASSDPQTAVVVERLELTDAELGFVNRDKDPGYRVFVSDTTVRLRNLSNGMRAGEATIEADGRFMGKGKAKASAKFRPPTAAGPDFDMAVAIENTPMITMNDLFRSYGKFDVTAGTFSFFSELAISKGRIQGYVKPLFKDMKVYDSRQDAEKSIFRKLYEKIVDGVSELLENPREDVATKAKISGPVENPNTSTLQVVLRLIENAFFRAILPGFDEEVRRAR